MKILDVFSKFQKIEEQKKQAKQILEEASQFFDFVLIAGGAPRNWAHQMPANDLDIYVCRKPDCEDIDERTDNGVKSFSMLYPTMGDNRAKTEKSSNEYSHFILNGLYDFSLKSSSPSSSQGLNIIRNRIENEEQKCQLIIIDDTSNLIKDLDSFAKKIFKTFDFGICMTSMDKDGNFYNSPLFETDKKNKTLSINIKELRRNNQAGMLKLVERFEKMEKYFPSHKMRIVR